jgi:hypothetical protein
VDDETARAAGSPVLQTTTVGTVQVEYADALTRYGCWPSPTIRWFPVVTEVCAQYVREVYLPTGDGKRLPLQEWVRAQFPLNRTNEACGVRNAATRKYMTQDHLWYIPPLEMMEKLVACANEKGEVSGRPYFSLAGTVPLRAREWEKMRATWHHEHGVTNGWSESANRGEERIKKRHGSQSVHANQKPLTLWE